MRRFFTRLDPYLLLLLVLTLFSLTPLWAPGYFYEAHDGRHSVFYVAMFDEAIRDGAIWPRWAMHHNQGYGYPTFVLVAPLAFYVAELFVLLGLGITTAVKIGWALGFLASAWGMYALVRYWIATVGGTSPDEENKAENEAENTVSVLSRFLDLPRLAALIAGLLYVYAPYHLLDIYVRAAFAETLLIAWVPWVFLAFDRLIARGADPGWQGRLLVAALSYAGMLLTHAFALLAVTPLLVAFVLFRLWLAWMRQREQYGSLLRFWPPVALAAAAGVAALLLTAIFILPLLVEGELVVQEDWTRDTYHYSLHWVHWGQFLNPFWGYGFSDDPGGVNDGMGFQIGVMLVLLALVAIYLLLRNALTPAAHESARPSHGGSGIYFLMLFLLLASAAVLFAMTPSAAWLWRSVPALAVVQFPWRLLALTSFSLSALGGLALWQLARESNLLAQLETNGASFLLMGLLVVFASFGYSRPESLQPVEPWREDGRAIFQFEQEHPDMLSYTRYVEESYSVTPLTAQYLAEDFSNDMLKRLAILAGEGEVLRHYSRGHSFGGEVRMATPGTVQVRVFEFPGWQVRLDGEPVPHRLSPPHGLIEVDVPAGYHRIDVRMGTTPVRTAGALISGLTLLGLVGLWGYGRMSTR